MTALANSTYIAVIAEALYGSRPRVLHPPVDVEPFTRYGNLGFSERSPEVVVMGRISPEKNVEVAVEAVSLAEARPRLVLIGAVAPSAKPYLARLQDLAQRLGVALEVHSNVDRDFMARRAARARVYVHTTIGEHFGITVVEAMALGLPVAVHASGGPFHDIIERGAFGASYKDPHELDELVDRLVFDEKLWERYHRLSLARYKEYTLDAFRSRLARLLAGPREAR